MTFVPVLGKCVHCQRDEPAWPPLSDDVTRRLEAAQRLADALRYWLPDESMASNEYTHEWNKAAAALAEWEATK